MRSNNMSECTLSVSNCQETTKQKKRFMRRKDLTSLIRAYIATTVIYARSTNTWGIITKMAKEFQISRTFVYILATTLIETNSFIYGSNFSKSIESEMAYCYMLSLRLEGKCSIVSISTIMKRFGIQNSSEGSISETLKHFGYLLPNTLETNNIEVQLAVIYLSDEIFANNVPILVTVDPISSAILRIELSDTRNAESWKNHWDCIYENGIVAAYLVSDQGSGICKAHKEALSDTFRQPDTYHAIAHQLGRWVAIIENAAYKAIESEYDSYDKLDSAKTEEVISKRIEKYEAAAKNANNKIELYDNFKFLYSSLIEELNVFDKNGNLRSRNKAEENMEASLRLIESLGKAEINGVVKRIQRTLPDLLNYFDVAKEVVDELINFGTEPDALKAICLGWQWRKGAIKSKKTERMKYCKDNEQFCLEIATGYLQENLEIVKEQVYNALDRIVQSSSLVECINSIIRPYCNVTKNHMTQEFLNQIMFYHNHRRYISGKRKGKTPMEILTGIKQEKEWLELLLDYVAKKDPSFFASS